MLPNLNALLAPALMERLVLVVNHVLLREPVAVARLLPHQGRVMRLELLNLPRLLAPNPPPPLAFIVTPAGGVEWCREPVDADLRVRVPNLPHHLPRCHCRVRASRARRQGYARGD